jgi:hypothetical protein
MSLTTAPDQPIDAVVDTVVAVEPSTSGRSWRTVAGWSAVGLGLVAAGALAVSGLTAHHTPAKVGTSRAVIQHGSISAIDHRDAMIVRQHTPSQTVAEHGSVAAIDHRDASGRR